MLRSDENYSMTSVVTDHLGKKYVMNEIFKKTIGGLIDKDLFDVCNAENCDY